MLSVKGTFQNGVAQPSEPIEGREGRPVLITFLDEVEERPEELGYDPSEDSLIRLIDECGVDSGIGDLAHQHDHYLYGTPKRP
jgi:hypothetical protein